MLNFHRPRSFSSDVKTSSPKSRICTVNFHFPELSADLCRTPGKDLEAYLNANYGPGNPIYEDLCSLTREGVEQGWAANIPIDGDHYRRSKISLPKEETRFFSITAVYVDSEEEFSGQHHSHPYGEINCVVQIDEGTELKGMQGWQGAGWTSPGPGTHQYARLGRLLNT